MKKKMSVLKIVFIIWVVFASLYVVYGEYMRLANYVAQSSYNKGYQDSVSHLVTEVSKCQPVPISIGNQSLSIVALECMQQQKSPMQTQEEVAE